MRRIRRGGRRRIGRRAHAGFVGEQAALHAPGHRPGDTVTDGAGRGFLQAEGAFEDQRGIAGMCSMLWPITQRANSR